MLDYRPPSSGMTYSHHRSLRIPPSITVCHLKAYLVINTNEKGKGLTRNGMVLTFFTQTAKTCLHLAAET